MKAIAVDDEIYMLETLQEAVSASSDIEMVEAFSSCSAALTYATGNPVDVAFLDINMRGIGGLGLAEKLLETNSVSTVSEMLEFSSIYAFSRAFKRYFNVPPSKFAAHKEKIKKL